MSQKIIFHSNQLSFRGTEIALYDYALHNETLLNNTSVVAYQSNNPNNDPEIIEKFKKRFTLLSYDDFS